MHAKLQIGTNAMEEEKNGVEEREKPFSGKEPQINEFVNEMEFIWRKKVQKQQKFKKNIRIN